LFFGWLKLNVVPYTQSRIKKVRKKNIIYTDRIACCIGVISLLLGILLPVVNRARASGLRTVCKGNLRSIGLGFRMYLDDNVDVMPVATNMPSRKLNALLPITKFILPYVSGKKETFECPADKGQKSLTGEKYFITETSSYTYNTVLGGKPVNKSYFVERQGEKEINIQVMNDYWTFHGKASTVGAENYLYADGHVGDLRKQ